jgi:hypothetical protein
MEPSLARTIWHRLEPLNAVTYFSPECKEGPERRGLKGFWMGYFANRAAPLGPVGPGEVEALFFNFHPHRVRRALPDAWDHLAPAEVLAGRQADAAVALRRLLPDGDAEAVAIDALPILHAAIDAAVAPGHPLFAANRDLSPPDDPVAALWLATTTLREHRGDAHVALLTAAGLDGCEVLVLFAASERVDADLFQRSRGWSADEWQAAIERLTARGLVAADGSLTDAGRRARDQLEAQTDELALAPYAHLGDDAVGRLLAALGPAARRVATSGDLIFPNPMGLPDAVSRPTGDDGA